LEEGVLRQFGLKRKSYFCIAIRDGFYHSGKPGQNDESYRNLDFSLFIPMIQCESLNSINFVRMGRTSKNYFEAKNLFDYTLSKDASDLADLILLKNSLGLINSGDGIGSVAEVLDIPVFFISHAPWEILHTFSENNCIVPALFYDEKSDALANANRIFDYEKIPMSKSSYWAKGLKLVPPSSEEIKIYCREFISWVGAEVKEEIKSDERCFWEKFYKELPEYAKPYHVNIKAKVPRYFVDKYSKILFI
jgi:putative glycosyltransferase (TIGR04372 family)